MFKTFSKFLQLRTFCPSEPADTIETREVRFTKSEISEMSLQMPTLLLLWVGAGVQWVVAGWIQ